MLTYFLFLFLYISCFIILLLIGEDPSAPLAALPQLINNAPNPFNGVDEANFDQDLSDDDDSDEGDDFQEDQSLRSTADLFAKTPNVLATRSISKGPLRPGGRSIHMEDIVSYYSPDSEELPEEWEYWQPNDYAVAFKCEDLGLNLLRKPPGGERREMPAFTLLSAISEIKQKFGDYTEFVGFRGRSQLDELRFLEVNTIKVCFIFLFLSIFYFLSFLPRTQGFKTYRGKLGVVAHMIDDLNIFGGTRLSTSNPNEKLYFLEFESGLSRRFFSPSKKYGNLSQATYLISSTDKENNRLSRT